MPEKLTWRSSDAFAAALRAYRQVRQEFIDTVVSVFNEQEPKHEAKWLQSPASLDPKCVGFADGTPDVPEGLSRAQNRDYLIPVRGSKGDRWRTVLDRMKQYPSMDHVFKAHGVHTMVFSEHTLHTPGMFDDGTHFYLICKGDIAIAETKHLVPIKMSEFYAAKEAWESSTGVRS